MELYNFTLISGSDCLVECASGGSDLHRWCGRGAIVCPLHLAQEIPTFARWLLDHVRIQMASGVGVDPNMVVYFCPQSTSAYT